MVGKMVVFVLMGWCRGGAGVIFAVDIKASV